MDINNFAAAIEPFFWVEHESTVSVCLTVGEYKRKSFNQEKMTDLKVMATIGSLWLVSLLTSKRQNYPKALISIRKEVCSVLIQVIKRL